MFKHHRFPKSIILQAVYFKLRFTLSYRDVEELLQIRGVEVDHSTIQRWVFKYSPEVEKNMNKRKRQVGSSWRMDETYIKVGGKFLIFNTEEGKVKRYQFTAIDDCTRVRAIKVYEKHNQKNAIDFLDYVIDKFPFRIHTIQTDNGHEFQSKFNWHVQDKGMNHRYIKPGKPQHNGKVERSHLTDKREFYQLLKYTDDVDLGKKLKQWEDFYNFNRPHGAFKGKTPYEELMCHIKN